MTSHIHPTALIGADVRLGPGCRIGPYTVIESGAVLGADNELGAGCYVYGCVRLGERNRLQRGASLGGEPQSLGYKGEPTTLVVGSDNWFGENTTVHRGTTATGQTVLGDHNYLMVNTHIGHDVRFGDRIICGPGVMVGGEAQVQSRANLGGGVAVHQLARVGELAMVGGLTRVLRDVLPFTLAGGEGALYGFNRVGIRRAGLPREHVAALQQAYRAFCLRRGPLPELRALLEAHAPNPFSAAWLAFTAQPSRRGYLRGAGRRNAARAGSPGDEADAGPRE